jgi:hypothetical protein
MTDINTALFLRRISAGGALATPIGVKKEDETIVTVALRCQFTKYTQFRGQVQ